MEILNTLTSLLFQIPNVLILIGCIIYIKRRKSLPATLMLIGSASHAFFSFFSSFFVPLLADMDIIGYNYYGGPIYYMLMIFNLLSFSLFGFGFLMLVSQGNKGS